MRRYITILIVSAVAAFSAHAQSGSFLNVPQTAREMAMGGVNAGSQAETVLDDAVFSASVSDYMWNPSGVSSNIAIANVAYRLGKLSVFTSDRISTYKAYPLFDSYGNQTGEYKPSELQIGLGAAYKILPGLAVSVSAEYIGTNLTADMKKSAFCADINAVFRLKSLTAGATIANVGTGNMPMLMEVGARNEFGFGPAVKLGVGLDAGYMAQGQNNSIVASAGVDLKIINMISVMAGYHFSTNTAFEPSYISAGLGVDIAMIKISASYLTGNPYIGNTLGFSLGCAF